ncbi:MAG: DUF1223 domain-containing protein [Phycisphaerales bacterium]|nr:DUF1223 domain-containing protein [Phycisphaerales bacterium]
MLVSLLASVCAAITPNAAESAEAAKPVAVVELFTSEGCSSCPPADALLTKLIKEHEAAGDLISLSFHVDYWDRLGWKDPWSTAAATARQQQYANRLGSSLYTPQMVLNGNDEFVGSDAERARARIAAALKSTPRWTLAVEVASGTKENEIAVHATPERMGGASKSSDKAPDVVVAIVERGLTSSVRRGENAGRTLSHDNVVRASKVFAANAKEPRVLELPQDLKRENASVVVLAQEASGVIVAAKTLPLPAAKPTAPEKAPDEPRDPETRK